MAIKNENIEIYFRIDNELFKVGNYATINNLLPNIIHNNNIILEPYGYEIYFEGAIKDDTFKTYIEVEKILQNRERKNISLEIKNNNEFLIYAKGSFIKDLSLSVSSNIFSVNMVLIK